jgi:RNA polymerase sigma factor for flagellar operon FliA
MGRMRSMHGVASHLVLRHTSWVRQMARTLGSRLPAHIQQADLIQAGLIAVAQALATHPGLASQEPPIEFLRYARQRVRGAMLDELRQMDVLTRTQRQQARRVDMVRQQWQQMHRRMPGLQELAQETGLSPATLLNLEQALALAQGPSEASIDETTAFGGPERRAGTLCSLEDALETRQHTQHLLNHLQAFVQTLTPAEQELLDAWVGLGLEPAELARQRQLSLAETGHQQRLLLRRARRYLQKAKA